MICKDLKYDLMCHELNLLLPMWHASLFFFLSKTYHIQDLTFLKHERSFPPFAEEGKYAFI